MREYIDPVIKYPNSILRVVSTPIEVVNAEVKDFTQMLLIVCRKQNGLGLSAPQVGKSVRIIVIDTKKCPLIDDYGFVPGDCSPKPIKKEYKRERHCYLINPVISNVSKKEFKYKEGCLSLPGVSGWVSRPTSFDVTFQDINGKVHTEHIEDTSTDIYGIIVQHELDHLDGKLFIDKINKFDKMKLTNKINKLRKFYG
jgi:peptide deformylase